LWRTAAGLQRRPRRDEKRGILRALAGISPVDGSSGKQQRHRLNRGRDRQLNWALHVIALARIQHHPETDAPSSLRSYGTTSASCAHPAAFAD
jgi:transposase